MAPEAGEAAEVSSAMDQKTMRDVLRDHVRAFWPDRTIKQTPWKARPVGDAIPALDILVVPAVAADEPVVYISCGASSILREGVREEFLIVAPEADEIHREHLAMIANFHADRELAPLEPGRIVNVGRPWAANSRCDHFLVSLPYIQGPEFEWCHVDDERVRFLWLTPITRAEADYAREHGAEALESLLEENGVVVTEPLRESVVGAGASLH